MAYPAKAVANFFLGLSSAQGKEITPMKIQKLVYYAHGWHLAIVGQPLINEQIEAWDYGPVVPSLYRAFKKYGTSPITHKATSKLLDNNGEWSEAQPEISDADTAAIGILNKVWDIYGKYSPIQLSKLTHNVGTPWRQVINDNGGKVPRGTDIPVSYIRDYFLSLGNKGK